MIDMIYNFAAWFLNYFYKGSVSEFEMRDMILLGIATLALSVLCVIIHFIGQRIDKKRRDEQAKEYLKYFFEDGAEKQNRTINYDD